MRLKQILILSIMAVVMFVAFSQSSYIKRNIATLTYRYNLLQDKNMDVGIYPGGKNVSDFEEKAGIEIDHVLLFQDVKSLDYSKVTSFLDDGYEVILNIQFKDDHPNLKDVAAGAYDTQLLALAAAIKQDGRPIWLRPLHEFNGDWYNWAVYYPGNDIKDFRSAWKHVVTLFRAADAPVQFQLDYNRFNAGLKQTPFSEFWPGDDYVDMLVITSYNRAFTDGQHQFFHSFREDFDWAYWQAEHLTDEPLGIAEMSSTSQGGNKVAWIKNAFWDIAYRYPRIKQVTWFAYNRPVDDAVWDWDLNSPAEMGAFSNGVKLLKSDLK